MKEIKAFAIYMTYFGTKYISEDIHKMCDHVLDNPYAKTLTMISIMYLVFEKWDLSIIASLVMTSVQMLLTRIVPCRKCNGNGKCDCRCRRCSRFDNLTRSTAQRGVVP